MFRALWPLVVVDGPSNRRSREEFLVKGLAQVKVAGPDRSLSWRARGRGRRDDRHSYAETMERRISGFHRDDDGDWVAELECLHGQHVRHRPPFQMREWVMDDLERSAWLGTVLDCPLCDRCEAPENMVVVRSGPVWDESDMPSGLQRSHRIASGIWGRLNVQEGQVRFRAQTSPGIDITLRAPTSHYIPPELAHDIEPIGSARFSIEWLKQIDKPC